MLQSTAHKCWYMHITRSSAAAERLCNALCSVQYLEHSLLLLITSVSDLGLPLHTTKLCSVVFSKTSRLLVINSSSSVSCEQQTTCHDQALLWFNTWWSHCWKDATKPDIGCPVEELCTFIHQLFLSWERKQPFDYRLANNCYLNGWLVASCQFKQTAYVYYSTVDCSLK